MKTLRSLIALAALLLVGPAWAAANLTMASPSYGGSANSFGVGLTGGLGSQASGAAGMPSGNTWTAEARFSIGSSPSGAAVIIGQSGKFFLAVSSNGRIVGSYKDGSNADVYLGGTTLSSGTGTPAVADGTEHNVKLIATSSGASLALDGSVVATSTTAPGASLTPGDVFTVRDFIPSSCCNFPGTVKEVAIWSTPRAATAPSAPYGGYETGLVALYHLNGDGADSSGATPPSTLIAPNSAAILYSPYNWTPATSTSAITVNPGAYLRVMFTGTSASLRFDVSGYGANVPNLSYRIDGAAYVQATIASTMVLTMPTDTSDQIWHLLEVVLRGEPGGVNRWNTPINSGLTFNGLTLDSDASVAAPVAARRRILIFGDSITEGAHINEFGVGASDQFDAARNWPLELGRRLNAEIGVVAFGCQAYSTAPCSTGNVPVLSTSFASIISGVSRSFTPAPDAIIDMMGTNDRSTADATVQTAAQNFYSAILAATTSATPILIMQNLGNYKSSARQAAIAAVGNSRLRWVATTGVLDTTYGIDTQGLHPNAANSMGRIAGSLANIIEPLLTPSSAATFRRGFR